MTAPTRRTIARWTDRILIGMAFLGVMLGVAGLARDYQTRQLVDAPARAVATAACLQENKRWNAYLTTVQEVSEKRSPTETDAEYEARKARSEKILASIREVVTVPCSVRG